MKVNKLSKISSIVTLTVILSSSMTGIASAETNESYEKKLNNIASTTLNSFKLNSFSLKGNYKGDKLLLQKDSKENSRSNIGLNDVMQIDGDFYMTKTVETLSPEELAIESRLGLNTKATYTHMPLDFYQLIDPAINKTSFSVTVVKNAEQYFKDEIDTFRKNGKNWQISQKGKTKDYSWEWADLNSTRFKTSFILTNNVLTSVKHFTFTSKKFVLKDTTTLSYKVKEQVTIPKGGLYEYGTFVRDPEYKILLVKKTTEAYLNAIWQEAETIAKSKGRTTLLPEDLVASVQSPSIADGKEMFEGAFEVNDSTILGDKVTFCGVIDDEAYTYDIKDSANIGHSYFPSSCLDAGFKKL